MNCDKNLANRVGIWTFMRRIYCRIQTQRHHTVKRVCV